MPSDLDFMAIALEEAATGAAEGEVPVGAVVMRDGGLLARAHNRPIGLSDPAAHAEILAIRSAAAALGTYRLEGSTIYVTLEPCVMCIGAIINARMAQLKFGAYDEKGGAVGSVYDIGRDGRLNHRLEVHSGLMALECGALLQEFFRARR